MKYKAIFETNGWIKIIDIETHKELEDLSSFFYGNDVSTVEVELIKNLEKVLNGELDKHEYNYNDYKFLIEKEKTILANLNYDDVDHHTDQIETKELYTLANDILNNKKAKSEITKRI